MNSPELVIFDCDGVLVDSESISVGVLAEIIGRSGGALGEAELFERCLGRSMPSVVAILEAEFGFRFTEAHGRDVQALLFERFRAELKPVAGVIEVLRSLACKRCVASSSSPERMRLSLGVAGLLPLFEPHLFTASMVANGKPAPDLFLLAARTLSVAPEACVVIEDSAVGIEAARRAGMRALGFTGGSHAAAGRLAEKLEEAGADLIFSDMRMLPALFGAGAAAPQDG